VIVALASRAPAHDTALRHVALLAQQRDRLTRQKAGAEEAYLRQVARAHKEGDLSLEELAEAYYDYREVADTGYTYAWDRLVPVASSKITAYARSRPYREPNGPDGSWQGTHPFGDGPTPGIGTAVAYLLYDPANSICYIGSTASFRSRLNTHAKDGKVFTRWEARPCKDRRAAYDVEYRLIREHQPYLNSAGRL
jgi:hypothetical protein